MQQHDGVDESRVTLRDARPTYEDGLLCARYLDQASEGFHRFWMGPTMAHIIATAFSHTGHTYSYEHVTFAERDDQIVGMAMAFTAEQHRHFSEAPVNQAAGFHLIRMTLVALVLFPVFRVLDAIPDGDFYLLAIAVDPALRGEGIGAKLLNVTKEKARTSGSRRLSLHVAAPNVGAQRLYERFGMSIDTQWPKWFAKLYLMAKVL
jgi:ribosomal protein S18 acetylase RimI-like enzyme